jgi:hypothetical protein
MLSSCKKLGKGWNLPERESKYYGLCGFFSDTSVESIELILLYICESSTLTISVSSLFASYAYLFLFKFPKFRSATVDIVNFGLLGSYVFKL